MSRINGHCTFKGKVKAVQRPLGCFGDSKDDVQMLKFKTPQHETGLLLNMLKYNAKN